MKSFRQWLGRRICDCLLQEAPASASPRCDFDRLRFELRPGDGILVEGRSRIGDVIKLVTQSPWTHSALYIGRLCDIKDPDLQDRVRFFYHGEPDQQVLIEPLLGQETIVAPLCKYRHEHLRICRPSGLAPHDAERVIAHCIGRLGSDDDTRPLVDLAVYRRLQWSAQAILYNDQEADFRDQITALEEQQAEAATEPGIDADEAPGSPRRLLAGLLPRRKELGV